MTGDLARERLQVTFAFSVGFGFVALIVSPIAGALAFVALGWAFQVITLCGLLAGGLVIAFAWLAALQDARWMMVETIARELESRDAEREALQQGKVSTHVEQRGISNAVTVNNGPVESIRLVPVRGSGTLVDGVPVEDLSAFVEGILLRGHSQRAWMGKQLPSGRTIATFEEYRGLVSPLVKAGLIVGRSERSAGQLVTRDLGEIKRVLGL